MIISKKRLDEIVDKAVSDAIKENNAYREKLDYERYIDGRFNDIINRVDNNSSDIYRDMRNLREEISDIEDVIWRKINEIECKMSHKKKK